MKKLIPSFAMLLIAAILLTTSTYAWFSMNTRVNATNMQVKAIAEQGILINEVATYNSSSWDNSATTNQTQGIHLHATSTANTVSWYVAHSKESNDSASATANTPSPKLVNGYHALGTTPYTTAIETVQAAVAGTSAKQEVTYVDTGSSGYSDGEGYYVKYTYYLKSSSDAITTSLSSGGQNLQISAEVTANDGNTLAIDAALRIGVVINGKAYIFAPVSGATTTYYVNAGATATTAYTTAQATGVLTIPAVTNDGMEVNVYAWFEGEDAGLKTDNIIDVLDNITVSVSFDLVTLNATATDNGVSIS
jgi:hypothetical protein